MGNTITQHRLIAEDVKAITQQHPRVKRVKRVTDAYTIVIMDYTSGSLRFYYFDNEPEDPEEWIRTHDRAWSDSSCYWMGVKGPGIDEDHFYNADGIKSIDEGTDEQDKEVDDA